mgnify:CR=1 FL=1
MRWTRLLAPLFALAATLAAQPTAPKTLAIVAAASMRPALDEAKAAYEKAHPGIRLQISYGASGSLTAQIQQGAPVDVFLSADLAFPEKLAQGGLATADGVVPYAKGLLVLWVRKDTGADPAKLGLKALTDPAIKRIAIANPKLAPYGLAAETALQKAGLHETVLPKIVQAENINQAAQYLVTGATEAGFIALSLMDNATLKETGWTWLVPKDLYAPIIQGAVVLKRTQLPVEAKQYLDYLVGAEGFKLLQRYGFEKP